MDSPPDRPVSYAAEWRRWRRRWLLDLFLFIGYVPCVGALGILSDWLLHSILPIYVIGLAWMAAGAASWVWIWLFRCPRCHHPFFWRSGVMITWPFKMRCVYCSIPWGTLTDPGGLEQDLETTTVRVRKQTRRVSLIVGSFFACTLLIFAILGSIVNKRLADTRSTGDSFLSLLRSHGFAQAELLMVGSASDTAPVRARRVKELEGRWDAFEASHKKLGAPVFGGVPGLPHQWNLAYAIPDSTQKRGGVELNMVSENGQWRVKSLTFFNDSAQMLPHERRPVPLPSTRPQPGKP